MAALTLQGVKKTYDGKQFVLHGIDVDVADGEFVVMVGPSGCGKSTLLRMVAGLEGISEGTISIAGKVVNRLEPKDRNIAMVFQNYALYPHMSVAENMGYALKIAGVERAQIAKRVDAAAQILELGPLLARKPRELSGGQRQRVAMGRAIVREPAVFLFDEPLSNLDARLRVQMRLEIQRLHARLATTSLYVTHDQIEAMTLAQRVIVMNKGHAEQIGAPTEVYERPATVFVASFIGSPGMNLLEGRVSDDGSDVRSGRQRSEAAADRRGVDRPGSRQGPRVDARHSPRAHDAGPSGRISRHVDRRFLRTARRGQSRARPLGQARRDRAPAAHASPRGWRSAASRAARAASAFLRSGEWTARELTSRADALCRPTPAPKYNAI